MKGRTLVIIAAVVFFSAVTVRVIVGDTVIVKTRRGWRQVELAAAYVPLRAFESLALLSSPDGSFVGTDADVWFSRPLDTRWAWYTAPAQAQVRHFTYIELATAGVGIGAVFLRTVGKGLWFVLMLLVMRRRAAPSISHGSAHWAGGRELAAMRPQAGCADLVVGRVGRHLVGVPEREQYEHLLLVAPTGAGKTSGVILPNLLAEPGTRSLVIADPKRELLRKTTPTIRERYGAANVWVLDFLDPALSRGYNPLAYVTDAATADLFAQTWVRNTGESKDAFWSNAARTLIGAAALHLVATEEITPPLVALVELLCGTPAETVSATLADSTVPEVRRLARGFLANMAKNERLLGSVFTELPPRFTCLNLGEVSAVTSTNEIDFARLARTPTALYLALDPQYSKTLAPLTACFFLHFFTTLTNIAKAAPSGALPVSVMAYLDEFGTVGHIPEFASRMATVRSAGIGCLLVVQDLAQLTKAYGEEDADTILSNATTKLCLGRVTHDDAEYFSKLAGTTTVLSENRSASRALLVPWADRGNRGVGEAQRALITPDELRTMRDEVFMVAGHHNPVRARQRRYYDDPALIRLVPAATAPDALAALRRAVPLSPPTAPPDGREEIFPVTDVDTPDALQIAAMFALRVESAEEDGRTASLETGDDGSATQDIFMSVSEAVPVLAVPDSPTLTEAESALLRAMVDAPSANSAELGEQLGVAASTVRKRQGTIRVKLGGGEGDLVVLARTRGIVLDSTPFTDVASKPVPVVDAS